MACYKPVTAYAPLDGGAVSFHEKKNCREIKLPCGGCIGCRLKKRNDWALRCYLESKMHAESCFLTLTYRDECLPTHGSLHYPHVQAMWKFLRNRDVKFRYFMCGEYGDSFQRPHYHVLMFGYAFPDKVKCNSIYSKADVFRSDFLEEAWPWGFSSIGAVTFESAQYCAGYTMKKITGARAIEHYSRVDDATGEIVQVEPEFAAMSLKPGIGASWLRKYWRDIYQTEHDAVIVNASRRSVPRYFDRCMDNFSEVAPTLMDAVEHRKYQRALSRVDENSRERLAVREQIAHARLKFYEDRFA